MTIQGFSSTGSVYPSQGAGGAPPAVNGPLVTTDPSGGAVSGASSLGNSAAAQAPSQPAQSNSSAAAHGSQNTPAQVKSAVDALNQSMQSMNRDLTFSVDQSTKKMVVKVVEAQTGTVIAQIPSKQALAIAQSIDSGQQGLLLQEKA